MTFSAFDGLGWLLASLLPFILAQRWLHRELQAILLILTHRPTTMASLFSLIFLPGVVVHETSHSLTGFVEAFVPHHEIASNVFPAFEGYNGGERYDLSA